MSTNNFIRDIFSVFMFIVVVYLLFFVNGCAYQTSKWSEPYSGVSYKQTNITPVFGQQAESVGEMYASINSDGTWELMIGRSDKGVDNTPQVDAYLKTVELVITFGKIYAASGIPLLLP